LVKALFRTYQQKSEDRFIQLEKDYAEIKNRCVDLNTSHERLRDRWEDFLREYIKVDSTRGNKIDALFRVVDQMQETIKEIRPALNTRMEEMLARAISDVKLYMYTDGNKKGNDHDR